MIGRRCTHSNVFSRPVLIARDLSFGRYFFGWSYLSQVTYCGGYSSGVPPLPIPNREVKPVIADGTAPPGGRVGSCRFSRRRSERSDRRLFFAFGAKKEKRQRAARSIHWGTDPSSSLCRVAPKEFDCGGVVVCREAWPPSATGRGTGPAGDKFRGSGTQETVGGYEVSESERSPPGIPASLRKPFKSDTAAQGGWQ